VIEQQDYTASPDAVWAIIGDPAGIHAWHPAIAASPVRDGVRYVALEGGGEVDEPILEHSDDDRFYVYGMSRHPFELTDYVSRLSVAANGDGSTVTWTGDFEPADESGAELLSGIFHGVYRSGLDAVTAQLAG
jgi:hypothetical protein